jgi:O-acetyl-ADP-ribose deacetylase (regulator of RNase III)
MNGYQVLVGDITKRRVDAVVNAANSTLLGGGGVDGAIHRAGGEAILSACRALRASTLPDGLPTGEAVATTAGDLPARWVVHTVGPVWQGGHADEERLLVSAVDASLAVAEGLEDGAGPARSVAFPAISTGVYGFPRERAFPLIRDRLLAHLRTDHRIQSVELVLFSPEDLAEYRRVCP